MKDTIPQHRAPGRSFDDPNRPMGEDLVHEKNVPERAKAISVMRKADEFVRHDDPPAVDEATFRRALELAAGRMSVTLEEYDRIVQADPELVALEQKLRADALARGRRAPI